MIFQHLIVGFFLPRNVFYGLAPMPGQAAQKRGLAASVHATDEGNIPFAALAYKLDFVKTFIDAEVIELD